MSDDSIIDRNTARYDPVLSKSLKKAIISRDVSEDDGEKIQKRKDMFPKRIQDLLIDVWLLNEYDGFSEKDWDKLAEGVQDLWMTKFSHSIENTGYSISNRPGVRVGYTLGQFIRSLAPDAKSDEVTEDFLEGFLVAFLQSSNYDPAAESMPLGQLHSRVQDKLINRRRIHKNHVEHRDLSEKHLDYSRSAEEMLTEYGLDPAAGTVLLHTIGLRPNHSEFRSGLEHLLEHTPFREINQLDRQLAADADTIFNPPNRKKVDGVPICELIKIVPYDDTKNKKNVKSRLDEDLEQRSEYSRKSVTTALNSGAMINKRDGWLTHSIFEQDSINEKMYSLTNYGELLRRYGEENDLGLYVPWGKQRPAKKYWDQIVVDTLNAIYDSGDYDGDWTYVSPPVKNVDAIIDDGSDE